MRTRSWLLFLAAALPLATTACDPCAGIGQCTTGPRVGVQGQVLEANGAPSPGVRVLIERTGGVETERQQVRVTTDDRGMFEAHLDAAAAGEAILALTVESRDSWYRVDDVRVPTQDRLGEVHRLPQWVRRPFFHNFGELWRRTDGARIPGVTVEFVRTGGVELAGSDWLAGDRFTTTTDVAGRFELFGRDVTADSLTPVRGELAMLLPDRRGHIADITLMPTHLYGGAPGIVVVQGGPHFPYVGIVTVGGQPAGGVTVTFRRVGGAAGAPESFSVTSDGRGEFDLRRFLPTEPGDVVFDLTFAAPGLAPRTVRVVQSAIERDSWGEVIGTFAADGVETPSATRAVARIPAR